MRKPLILLFIYFFLFAFKSISQSNRYGNEWINYGQDYLKMIVDTKGIYRITKADLDTYGFATAGKNPNNFQVWFRGKEIAINASGTADNTFDDGDYIEFYAMNNDGKQDIELYDKPESKPATYTSLYSDETAYFLTVGTNPGKRMAEAPLADNSITPDLYFMFSKIKNSSTQWDFDQSLVASAPLLLQSKYEIGEGLTGAKLNKGYTESIVLDNLISGVDSLPKFEASLISSGRYNKTLLFNFGNSITEPVSLPTFTNSPTINNSLIKKTIATVTSNTILLSITYSVDAAPTGTANPFSFFYHKVTYPRQPIFADNIEYEILKSAKSHLQLSTAPAQIFGFDITDLENQNNINIAVNGGIADLYIVNTSTARKIFLSSTTKKPNATKLINFTQIDRSQNDFLIITDDRTRVGADAYKAYRETTAGGSYHVLVNETKAIYDEFCYGERNPIAIRRYMDYMTSTPQAIKYLFLIGKSISKPNLLKSRITDDYVPTFGYPGSDVLFSSGLLGYSEAIPSVPTGRLSVSTNTEVTNYLNKVIEHEAMTNNSWQKNFLGLAGPTVASETTLAITLESLRSIAINSSFGADMLNYDVITKPLSSFDNTTQRYPDFIVNADFYSKINNGVGIFAFYGRGNPTSSVYNFGYVSQQIPAGLGGPTNYINKGKYPLMLSYSSVMADSFGGSNSQTNDWVNTPDRGAIIALAQTGQSYETILTRNFDFLFNTLFGTLPNAKKGAKVQAMTNSPIGDVVKQAFINNATTNGDPINDLYAFANFQQTMLIGDPSVVIFKAAGAPLPLTLVEFKGENKENNNVLSWKTDQEKDISHFELEKSENAEKFYTLATISAHNLKGEVSNYSFHDFDIQNYTNYYRLKMVENDGKFTYSKIITINNGDNESELVIFGNPIVDQNFKFQFFNLANNSVKLYNALGNEINLEIGNTGIGQYFVKIKNNQPKGVYLFEVKKSNGEIFHKKLILE